MGIFKEDIMKKVVEIPENESVTAIIGMGYFEKKGTIPERKTVNEILRFI